MKLLYAFLLLLPIAPSAFSQHHLSCDNGIEVLTGITEFGLAVQPGYVRYFSKNVYAKLSPFYSKELDRGLFHYVTGLDLKAGYTLLNLHHSIYLSALGGVGFSSEKGRWREVDDYDYHQNKWSCVAGLEGEFYLGNHFSIVVNANQHIVTDFMKSWGIHRWYVMVGPRYHFYRLHKCNPAAVHRSKRK